jgi:NitT/TauT family transport system substrate-binding protein
MPIAQSRRRFLTNVAFLGAAGLSGLGAAGFGRGGTSLAAEPPPETTTIRLGKATNICLAPVLVAEELLRTEGFTDVRYVGTRGGFGDVPEAVEIGRSALPALSL